MIPAPEIQAKIAIWRRRAIEGTLTPEEMREAIDLLRQGRAAASAAVKSRAAKKATVNGDDLLDELEGL